MPYNWKHTSENHASELTLWPHNSLPPKGFAAFILATFTLTTIPLSAMIGTFLFWGLLPFILLALAGMWYALRRNERDRRILEVLTVTPDNMHLVRHNPRGPAQEWECNTYWCRIEMHQKGGPVPNYVTLAGSGREVEIGAFLSEDERKALYSDLSDRVRKIAHP
ncbi:DUF2244 domain-containing protein [Mesobacterium sp. TK19101]|uniref:DUF2244 domain-containing protein n=1 Tax=Mesobacterium hydrothermale TaxID=3111907 RepID=A0ABU6HCW9_9RHOB|nr:DUF2244 domain-containing protein [Mesobacterium sp. TK19101]MEC3860309.1 DUF2244 domain-containing protein [Mesobacterium sp. TK19101]